MVSNELVDWTSEGKGLLKFFCNNVNEIWEVKMLLKVDKNLVLL